MALDIRADGSVEHSLVGASPFPRHWLYDTEGKLVKKSGLIDFSNWYRRAFGKHSPWGDQDSPALATEVESALERQLSAELMQGKAKPRIRDVKEGDLITEQGQPGDELFLVLDGVVRVEVDGQRLAEYGPGSLHGSALSWKEASGLPLSGPSPGASWRWPPPTRSTAPHLNNSAPGTAGRSWAEVPTGQAVGASTISVFLADDNLIVREGVRALISLEDDFSGGGHGGGLRRAGVKSLGTGAPGRGDGHPDAAFFPPGRASEAAHEIRKRHPGTGVVVLSQFDDPEYAISLLAEGSAGYAYLLKDRVAEGDQLARAVRAVASGGSVLDPAIVDAMVHPVTRKGELSPAEEELLRLVAEGRPIKAIAVAQRTTPSAAADAVEKLFIRMAEDASSGGQNSVRRLRSLYEAIVNREEQGETLSRLLPGGVAEMLREQGCNPGETVRMVVSVLMSDIRGYSTIAEQADPSELARQLNVYRGRDEQSHRFRR